MVQSDHRERAVRLLTHIYMCASLERVGLGVRMNWYLTALKQYAIFHEWVRCAVPSVHRRHAIAEGG